MSLVIRMNNMHDIIQVKELCITDYLKKKENVKRQRNNCSYLLWADFFYQSNPSSCLHLSAAHHSLSHLPVSATEQ